MNSYSGGTSWTANNLFAVRLFATSLIATQSAPVEKSRTVHYDYPNNASSGNAATVMKGDQIMYKVQESRAQDVEFEQSVSGFYADLMVKQEPLGQEVSKVLYENLWDLYAR